MTDNPVLSFDPRKSCRAWNFVAALGVALSALLVSGCSGEDPRPDPQGLGGAGGGPGWADVPSCTDGAEKPCGITLEVSDGVMTCYRGTKVCEEGEWSECQGGTVTHEPHPFASFDITEFRTQSLSTPVACSTNAAVENPCDPECMYFDEDPDPGASVPDIVAPNPVVVTERTCVDGSGGEGDVCTPTSTGFSADCDPCVYLVCQSMPSCCTTEWTSLCANEAVTLCDPGNQYTINFCDMTLYSEGNMTLSNRPSTLEGVIASRGDMSVSTDAKFGSLYSEGSITIASPNGDILTGGGVIHANKDISIQASGYKIEADFLAATGKIDVNNLDVDGDIWAATQIDASSGANLLTGNAARAGTTISGNLVAAVGSTKTPGYATAPPTVKLPPVGSIPTMSVICTGTTNYNWSGGSQVLTPYEANGSVAYGDVSMNNNGSLTLRGQGTYYFKSLHISNRLILDPNGAPLSKGWDIRICNTNGSLFDNGFSMRGLSPLTNDANQHLFESKYVTIYYNGTADLQMGTDVYMTGILMAPNATVRKSTMNLGGSPTAAQFNSRTYAAPINGAIWSKGLSLDTDAYAYPISKADCENIDRVVSELPPANCELTTGMRGLHNEPCATGQDCQGNSSCIDPDKGACSHSPCVVGDPLSSSCNDCAQRICDVDSSCCSERWDSACVALTASVCDVTCETSDCNQDACVTSSQPMDPTCDDSLAVGQDCISDVCAAMPSCCSTAWTAACITELYNQCPSAGNRLCNYAAYGSQTANVGATSTVAGTIGTDATVSPAAPMPTINFGCQTGGSNINASSLSANSTTYYNSVTIQWNGTLTFPLPGTYHFNSLRLEGGNTITVPTSGIVEIYVCGKIYFGQDTRFNGITSTGTDAMRLRIYSNFDGADAIWSSISYSNLDRFGLWVAPYGEVRLGVSNRHSGALWGETVTLYDGASGGSITKYDTNLKAYCVANNLDGGAPPGPCPVEFEPEDPPVTPTSAKCIDNADGYEDPTCAGYDLAVGAACGDEVQVCNHGTVDLTSSSVVVGYWHEDTAQFAIEEPYVSPSGTCTQTMSIAAGSCETMTCAIPTDADYLLMVDPDSALSECDDRRLDNWSVDNGGTCATRGPPEYYDYTADCPDDASVKWRFLTWDATTPGTSEIVFSAQVTDDLSAIDPSAYVQLGTASTAAGTEDCPYVSATPCYANLDTALGLGQNQDNYLSLEVQYNNNGSTAVLEDWAVIYTCSYDQ